MDRSIPGMNNMGLLGTNYIADSASNIVVVESDHCNKIDSSNHWVFDTISFDNCSMLTISKLYLEMNCLSSINYNAKVVRITTGGTTTSYTLDFSAAYNSADVCTLLTALVPGLTFAVATAQFNDVNRKYLTIQNATGADVTIEECDFLRLGYDWHGLANEAFTITNGATFSACPSNFTYGLVFYLCSNEISKCAKSTSNAIAPKEAIVAIAGSYGNESPTSIPSEYSQNIIRIPVGTKQFEVDQCKFSLYDSIGQSVNLSVFDHIRWKLYFVKTS